MPLPVAMIALALATALVVFGIPLAANWHSWADRSSAWSKRTFGRFGNSPTYNRAIGITWVVLGIILYVAWVVSRSADIAPR